MSENRQNLTKAGNIKAPSRGEVATWVAKAWAAVDEQLIRRAFVKSGLSQSFIRQTDMMDVDDDPVRGEDSCPLFDHPDNFLSYDDVLEDLPIEFLSIWHPLSWPATAMTLTQRRGHLSLLFSFFFVV